MSKERFRIDLPRDRGHSEDPKLDTLYMITHDHILHPLGGFLKLAWDPCFSTLSVKWVRDDIYLGCKACGCNQQATFMTRHHSWLCYKWTMYSLTLQSSLPFPWQTPPATGTKLASSALMTSLMSRSCLQASPFGSMDPCLAPFHLKTKDLILSCQSQSILADHVRCKLGAIVADMTCELKKLRCQSSVVYQYARQNRQDTAPAFQSFSLLHRLSARWVIIHSGRFLQERHSDAWSGFLGNSSCLRTYFALRAVSALPWASCTCRCYYPDSCTLCSSWPTLYCCKESIQCKLPVTHRCSATSVYQVCTSSRALKIDS